MASGALGSLGLGSSGALSYDVIDQLKAADKSVQVDPIESKMTKNQEKKDNLKSITTLLAGFKSPTSALADETTYLKRSSSVSGESVSASVSAGVSAQSIDVDVKTLAKKDIHESKGFEKATSTFTSVSDTINLTIGSGDDAQAYSFSVNAGTTLEDLAQLINDEAGGKAVASVMNVGGDEPYKLIIKSAETGTKNDIKLESVGSAVADLGLNNIQNSSDAVFKFNGMEITRSSNTITDLINGLSLTLQKDGGGIYEDEGVSRINITQDTTAIKDEVTNMVSKYNELLSSLNEATKYDAALNTSGIFQGISEISSIKSDINKFLTTTDANGVSLSSYGIKFDSSGILKLDSSIFDSKMSKDPSALEKFFRGDVEYSTTTFVSNRVSSGEISLSSGDLIINDQNFVFQTDATNSAEQNAQALKDAINNAKIGGIRASIDSTGQRVILEDESGGDISIKGNSAKLLSIGMSETSITGSNESKDGIFADLNNYLKGLITGDSASLNLYEDELDNDMESLQDSYDRATEQLNQRYEQMAKKFASYDSMIGKLTTQFQSLQMMIDSDANSD